jgi:F0F1-type ATP synthase membrane subunit c/vacuolar-type H+-ATPase subunit K
MAGAGAAIGTAATSAAVSGGVGIATAHSQTVEGDAKNTAEEIVKELRKFFAEQGWIAPR